MNHSKHFRSFVIELAAVVFLVITAPFWIPIAVTVGIAGLGIAVIGAVLLFLLSMCAHTTRADELVQASDYLFLLNL